MCSLCRSFHEVKYQVERHVGFFYDHIQTVTKIIFKVCTHCPHLWQFAAH